MKKNILFLAFLMTGLFYSSSLFSQVSSYPYIETYESPSIWQGSPASCDATVNGATITGWTQITSDDGDWRADTAGTTSSGTGPGSTRTTSGSGTGTDANPGTTSGTYLYTEATNATACSGSEIIIESPYFDFSATGKYYQLKLNYHMFGTGMGSMHIDVKQGTNGTWANSLWSQVGEKDSLWNLAVISLANYDSDSVRIRVRGVMGANYISDMAFDNFQIDTFTPPLADAILLDAKIVDFEYPIMPIPQFDSITLSASVKNEGINTITNAQVTVTATGFSSTIDLDSVQSFAIDTALTPTKYGTNTSGLKSFYFATTITQTEAITTNNYDTVEMTISDTTMAREDLTSTTNGIGFNTGLGEVGQRFEIFNADTITSVTFYIPTPNVGDSVRAVLRNFGSVPGSVIETSETIQFISGQNWYTVPLKCFTLLSPGQYFVAIEQLVVNSNMGLGYTSDYFTDSTSFFGSSAGWTPLEDVGFNTTQLIRINFGHYNTVRNISISASEDTLCPGTYTYLQANKNNLIYSWAPASLAFTPLAKNTLFDLTESTMVKLTANFGCGLTALDSTFILVKKSPTGTITDDTTICRGNSLTLQATGGSSYQWIGGPSNADWTVTPTTTVTTYNVTIDSTNGCSKNYNLTLTLGDGFVEALGDTTVCSGYPITINASGSDTYQWTNGPATSDYTFNVTQTGYQYVEGTDQYGCVATDSVYIIANQSPVLTPLNDTGACFTKDITLTAGAAADSFLWSSGENTQAITFKMFAAKTLSFIARNSNGCESYDTVFIDRYLKPTGSIVSDTTICEGTEAKINAYGGDSYEWSTGDLTQEVSVSPTTETTYNVTIRNNEGCEDFKDVTVFVDPLPIPAFTSSIYKDSVVFANQSTLATSYSWDFGDGSSSTDENTYHIYTTTNSYSVVLTATNDCGSIDSSITISVTVPEITDGIDDISKWNKISFYPMPVENILHFDISNQLYGELNIQLLDIAGRVLNSSTEIKSNPNYEGKVSLANYPTGVYFLQMAINGSTISSKIIKK